jgi:DNA-binding CsgD family transcriptional regulator
MGKLEGRISVFRPRHLKNFSAQEILLARELSPYLALSVQNAKLFKHLEQENIFRRIDDEHSSQGYVLFDDHLEQLFVSRRMAEFIDSLKQRRTVEDPNCFLPKEVMGDCLDLRNCMYEIVLPLPKNRVVRISTGDYFVFHSQVIHRGFWMHCPARIMVIFEKFHGEGIDQESLRDAYGLTKREAEIVAMVGLGLRNAQIAYRLFVSEITVKKHIQNIFDKMGVNNRTEMVSKLHPTSMEDSTEASHIPPVHS